MEANSNKLSHIKKFFTTNNYQNRKNLNLLGLIINQKDYFNLIRLVLLNLIPISFHTITHK